MLPHAFYRRGAGTDAKTKGRLNRASIRRALAARLPLKFSQLVRLYRPLRSEKIASISPSAARAWSHRTAHLGSTGFVPTAAHQVTVKQAHGQRLLAR